MKLHLPLHRRVPTDSLLTWKDRIALSTPMIAIGRCASALAYVTANRRSRPWLSMVAVPLALNAATLTLFWWAWFLLVPCIWWWSDRTWRWTWLVGVQASAFGTLWMWSGAEGLAESPDLRWLVAAYWIGTAGTLAACSAINRRRYGSLPDYPGH